MTRSMVRKIWWVIAAAFAAAGCWVASSRSEGGPQVVTWNRFLFNPRACQTVSEEMLSALRTSDGGADELTRTADRELRAYRACEAYGNGAISDEQYRGFVLGDAGTK
jgi:hypothetical protein